MKYELGYYDFAGDINKLQSACFMAEKLNFECLNIPLGLFSEAKHYVSSLPLSVMIDYPYGINHSNLKYHAILDAKKRGIKLIEVVLNHHHIKNNELKKVKQEIITANTACNLKETNLRYVIDYRFLEEEKIYEIGNILHDFGNTTIVSSTSTLLDDISDQIMFAVQMKKNTGIDVVICSNNLKEENIEAMENAKIKTLRINGFELAKRIFGV